MMNLGPSLEEFVQSPIQDVEFAYSSAGESIESEDPMLFDLDNSRNQDLLDYIQKNQKFSFPTIDIQLPQLPLDFVLETSEDQDSSKEFEVFQDAIKKPRTNSSNISKKLNKSKITVDKGKKKSNPKVKKLSIRKILPNTNVEVFQDSFKKAEDNSSNILEELKKFRVTADKGNKKSNPDVKLSIRKSLPNTTIEVFQDSFKKVDDYSSNISEELKKSKVTIDKGNKKSNPEVKLSIRKSFPNTNIEVFQDSFKKAEDNSSNILEKLNRPEITDGKENKNSNPEVKLSDIWFNSSIRKSSQNTPTNQTNKIRKYNWNPAPNITGRKLAKTDTYRSEPEGRHECPKCGVIFTHNRSLQVHLQRNHNSKANIPCPQNCGKFYTNKSALKKHKLSHVPEHEWPFICLFCGKYFQSRADLPKHFMSLKHKDDSRIPDQGTPQWDELLKRSEVEPPILGL